MLHSFAPVLRLLCTGLVTLTVAFAADNPAEKLQEKVPEKPAEKSADKPADKADDKEKKPKTIAEIAKTADRIDGLFPVYRDKKTGKVHLELSRDVLGKEFILFSYTENGLAGVGHFRGRYPTSG